MHPRQPIHRRAVLGAGALLGAAAVTHGASLARPLAGRLPVPGGSRRTKRVILVAFAGGVRTKETFGTPSNVPNLLRLAAEGVVYPHVRTSNLGHFGASLALFTGVAEARGIRDNAPGDDPTVFEYVRKDLGLPSGSTWIATSGGAQQSNYAYSLSGEYGARYGANTLDGDGIFNAEFKELLGTYGRPREWGADEQRLLGRMRDSIRGADQGGIDSPATAGAVERYILDELTRGTVEMRGTGAGDAKALRVARNLLSVFRPTLLGVALRNADVAHGSYNAYVEVIRRNDQMVGELLDAVKADPELAESTAIFLLPEFGRDSDLNSRRGLDHGDDSDDLNLVSLVAWGPDFERGKTVNEEVRAVDVCPTVCELLGARARHARGRRLPGLLA